MKVKATINSWDFIPNISGNLVRFDAVFATEKSTKIDPKSFKEIEFDIPVVNELEKYSSNDLQKELLRREEGFSKSFSFCSVCQKPRVGFANYSTGVFRCLYCGRLTASAILPE